MRNILLVGNESEELLLFAETLARYDYSVMTSGEDLSGISRICKDSHIDLVIADCWMPGRDGLDHLSALRQSLPAIPVILLTSRQFKVVSLTAKRLGANTYIVKQVKASNLERLVTAILTGNRTAVV